MNCLTDAELSELREGALSIDRRTLLVHLDGCGRCETLVGTLLRTLRATDLGAPPSGPGAAAPRRVPHSGETFDRYVVLELLGSGATGAVCAAYDPVLHRKVALKLWAFDGPGAEERLTAEARALAKLAHPNVVPVYEVGRLHDQFFVAMELVEGPNLWQWLHAARRSWREVLAAFLDAGRGLAAAHRAHLVHRDFKAQNVVVDASGRVRVIDFGVAESIASADRAYPRRRGAGTPAYMAPEQRRGEPAHPQSDQYSFCVALHEALAGRLPPGRIEGVPATLERVVARGRSPACEDRYPSMDELIAALERVRRRSDTLRWARPVAAVVLGLTLAAGGAAWSRAHRCDPRAAALEQTWNAQRRRAVASAFRFDGPGYQAGLATLIDDIFDGYARRWLEADGAACRRLDDPSGTSAARRCLIDRLEEWRALQDVFAQAGLDVANAAAGAAHSLSDPDECLDPAAVARPGGERATWAALQHALAEARALSWSARYGPALERTQALLEQVRAEGARSLEPEVLLLEADVIQHRNERGEAEPIAYQALWSAVEQGNTHVEARAAALLTYMIGAVGRRFDEGERLAQHAAAAAARSGDARLQARAAAVLANLERVRERWEPALQHTDRALELLRQAGGERLAEYADVLSMKAVIYGELGREDLALPMLDEAVAALEGLLGAEHPRVANKLQLRALSLRDLGRLADARRDAQRSVGLLTVAMPGTPTLADALLTLAELQLRLGEDGRAEAGLREVIAIDRRVDSVDGPDHAAVLGELGVVLIRHRRLAEASQALGQSAAALARDAQPAPKERAQLLGRQAQLAIARGDPAQGLRQATAALALLEGLAQTDHLRATLLLEAGRAAALTGDSQAAQAMLAPAVATLEGLRSDPLSLARARLALARAQWDAGRKAGAVQAARRARDELVALAEGGAAELGQLPAWVEEADP